MFDDLLEEDENLLSEYDIYLKKELARLIVEAIQEEFRYVYLTKQLVNSIKINTFGNNISIEIAPEIYDINYAIRYGVIKPGKRQGSYASEVDKYGGISGKHKDYLKKCIDKGIQKWLNFNNINARIR